MRKRLGLLKKAGNAGFTLLELIAVIAILGILATIAIPRLGGFTMASKNQADEASALILTSAAKMYKAEHGTEAFDDRTFPQNLNWKTDTVIGPYLPNNVELQNQNNFFVFSGGVFYATDNPDELPAPDPEAEGPFTVTFRDWDGQVLKSETVTKGGAASAPANPTREGYVFTGWSPVSYSNITGNLTVTAQYNGGATGNYTITFISAGGSSVASITQAAGTAITPPAPPTRSGYTFSGWSPALPTTMPVGGATLTAQWSENVTVKDYNVSNRSESSSGTGQSRVWTVSADITIKLSNGSSYFHGRVTGSVTSPNVQPVTVNIKGNTSSGVAYDLDVTF